MKQPWAASLGALFVIALTLAILLRGDPLEYSPTSYGTVPPAYGALHDLLLQLGVPVERSFASAKHLVPATTVWWIEPHDVCAALAGPSGEDSEAPALDLAPWIHAGGTAVLFSADLADCRDELRIADVALPAVRRPPPREPHEPREDDAADLPETRDEVAPRIVTGSLVPTPRTLDVSELATFAEVPDGFAAIASVDGAPFALEARIGSGRLVWVTDALFLRNRWLDQGDAAPLAFDFVRAYGMPRLDERQHGLSETPSTLAYLAGSPALPVFAGLVATGLLFGWAGASLPRRRVGDERPDPPTLATYLDSVARLYARAGDHAEVFERYRAYGLAELRRALSLAHDAPAQRVQDALRGRPGVAEADVARLRAEVAVAGRGDLDAACAAIDRLLAEVR